LNGSTPIRPTKISFILIGSEWCSIEWNYEIKP